MSLPQDIKRIKYLPTAFVIFGATGDLAQNRIFPALFKLYKSGLLPDQFKVISCARTKHTSQEFREIAERSISEKDKEKFPAFYQKIEYLPLDVAQDLNLPALAQKIDSFEKGINTCPQRIFYMAISPAILEDAVGNLAKNNLHVGCKIHNNKPRIIIEKPFGQDLKSAKSLNNQLAQFFSEEQIYRIDHYLGKETIQNIFAFRFANDIFESLWNNKYIDHLQITTAEYVGVEKRGEFYDKTGALRDITQNHLLQLLTLVTMDEPQRFEPKSIEDKKLEVISSIKKLTAHEVATSTVRGQYEGYLREEKINPASQIETYALIKLAISLKRWQGVPFYLRTGKKLTGKVTSIIVQFKPKTHQFFKNFWQKPLPNHITIQIQPNEGIGIRLVSKKPGLTTQLEPVDMEFCYKTSFDVPQPEAYERLLLDVISEDQSLFLSQKIIEESWKVIDPIRQVWSSGNPPLSIYKPGSWGPAQADKLIEADGRQWLAPILTICKI
ncbi:glucose-6-phosphate dehydrogenase [Candidatus Curtissbacteria bacterium RIFCSPHIGHO2_01_FULL_41_44]|uniref:Glucose-6-phosphate 1-dehydrogenase n=1 Tax=Candidatus Curtissbacteria bacterium RIFCSPLOWO2_01_FULL_42_50 TaxID=1797730 RepID=A0A1F5H364_9BACT|nr:MAG: glucose-6-phosphate dehydrogenase [Candidatus Curtissbacteria bacterium RIFCSPHIGHO2_01_FULL_41_44]OGD92895.1 MAG: glucose-6-phosphate dehydrogenase [Candidatus Curtissbacteria bacterium RIFCSPHIGHO2_02_FULL_42_58]OGD96628.1 MAG: glucose-6-phosphate dehydrogenase [Candidatus Curtissbacteria bacterium RIFCSPHIGHO2_12_FULL_42_33]OGD98528.1 MAG: glucose-6-phosphate dehydrogenase [Candidatus Curtissbacteria bacterium RIFCSPLOWO2_01_FULL_42_50]OGE02876.1 MAG: glucose-6-phosphate dehydrogenas